MITKIQENEMCTKINAFKINKQKQIDFKEAQNTQIKPNNNKNSHENHKYLYKAE